MSRPNNTIQNIKAKRKREKERLKKKTNRLKDNIKGNPKVVEAIENLEKRIEAIETSKT